jgi:hypothetical protein
MSVFDAFSKATLIAYIREEGINFRYTKDQLVRHLNFIEWDIKAREVQIAMDKACEDMAKIDTSARGGHMAWLAAQETFSRALKKSKAIDKKYHPGEQA